MFIKSKSISGNSALYLNEVTIVKKRIIIVKMLYDFILFILIILPVLSIALY